MFGVNIRESTIEDLPAIRMIYTHEVLHGLASFEEIPPSLEDMLLRRRAVLDLGLPYLVAEQDTVVVGYSYASPYRPRRAYRNSVESSVYVAEAARCQGVGKALMSALIAQCESSGRRQMIAIIGDTDNTGSIGLHQSLGFRHAGILYAVGFKFGRWVDSVIMQRSLGEGDKLLP